MKNSFLTRDIHYYNAQILKNIEKIKSFNNRILLHSQTIQEQLNSKRYHRKKIQTSSNGIIITCEKICRAYESIKHCNETLHNLRFQPVWMHEYDI